jgi:hypothetical protein
MDNKKDPRWSKQFGDFGEQLVMYLIGRQKNIKVALVDHAGADLIASDLENKNNRYAISVKSHTLNINVNENNVSTESKLYNFGDHNIRQLKNFAENFELEPVVSIVIVQPEIPQDNPYWKIKSEKHKNKEKYFEKHDKLVIDIFTFLLSDAEKMIEEGRRYCTHKTTNPGGFNFKFENLYFEELLADKRIDHTRMSFDSIKYERLWDIEHPMESNAKEELSWEDYES